MADKMTPEIQTEKVLVLQEAFGVNAHIRDVTERSVRAGYAAIAPALFHRTDPQFEGSSTDFAAMPLVIGSAQVRAGEDAFQSAGKPDTKTVFSEAEQAWALTPTFLAAHLEA